MVTNDPVVEVLAVLETEGLDPRDVRGGPLSTRCVQLLPLVLGFEFLKLLGCCGSQ